MLRILFATLFLLVAPLSQAAPDTDQWEPEIRRFERLDREQPPAPGGVLFIGSSSIRMWDTLAEDFPGVPVINRGFGGSEIADSTRYADRIVIPYRPRLIVFYAGDNDVQNGKSAAQVAADFKAFVERVRHELPETRIAFIAIKPSPARVALLDVQRDANRRIRRYAAWRRGIDYIDISTPMLDMKGQPRAELFGPDGLHLNRAGYALWVERVTPYL